MFTLCQQVQHEMFYDAIGLAAYKPVCAFSVGGVKTK